MKGDGSFNLDAYNGDGEESLVSRQSFRAEPMVFADELERGGGMAEGVGV